MFKAATHPGVTGHIAAVAYGDKVHDIYPLGQRDNAFYSLPAAMQLSESTAERANQRPKPGVNRTPADVLVEVGVSLVPHR